MNIKNNKCSICNYEIKQDEKCLLLTNKPDICLCKKCIEVVFYTFYSDNLNNRIKYDFFDNKEMITKKIQKNNKEIYFPQQIHEYLDKYIIGHEKTKKIISIAIFQHLSKEKMRKTDINDDLMLKKSNILLIGESGNGKTLFAETIAKMLEVPFTIADASSFTSKGYVGADTDDIIISLYLQSNNDIKKTEQGVVFIDEIDKISMKNSASSTSKDVTGVGVQENLLKMIEGTKIKIKNPNYNPLMGDEQTKIEINTKNILFIFGGAFFGLNKLMEDKKNKKVGFTNNNDITEKKLFTDYLLEYGFLPEFLGRIPIISKLNTLTKKELLKIITEPNNSILKQYKYFFKNMNIDIDIEQKGLNYIVEQLENNKMGARVLQKIFEDILSDILYNIENYINHKIIINEKYIKTKDKQDLQIQKKEIKQRINFNYLEENS